MSNKLVEHTSGHRGSFINRRLSIAEGGTNATTPEEARTNLGMVSINRMGVINGVAVTRNGGFLREDFDVSGIEEGDVCLQGQTEVAINRTYKYLITNFDRDRSYAVSAVRGTAWRNGDYIFYTSPATTGAGGFIVNNRVFSVTVIESTIARPTLLYPLDNGELNSLNPVLRSSLFVTSDPTEVHNYSLWQVATDAAFANIVYDSGNSTTFLTSTRVNGLTVGSVYYARVRHGSVTGTPSPWSTVARFTVALRVPETENALILSSEPTSLERFGSSVSIDGSSQWLAIAAAGRGYVEIYRKITGGWQFRQRITAPVGSKNPSYFGSAVTLSNQGSRLAIGNPMDFTSATNAGKAFLYKLENDAWVFDTVLDRGTEVADSRYGSSMDFNKAGTAIAIGAPLYNGGRIQQGAVYTLTQSVGNPSVWNVGAVIVAPDNAANDNFGTSVALSNTDVMVVGAPNRTSTASKAGSAYVFRFAAGVWNFDVKLEPSDLLLNDSFGTAVDVNGLGDTVFVGAPGNAALSPGKAYVFIYNAGWGQSKKYVPVDAADIRMGKSLATTESGDFLVIGGERTFQSQRSRGFAYSAMRRSGVWTNLSELNPDARARTAIATLTKTGSYVNNTYDAGGTANVSAVTVTPLAIPAIAKSLVAIGKGSPGYSEITPAKPEEPIRDQYFWELTAPGTYSDGQGGAPSSYLVTSKTGWEFSIYSWLGTGWDAAPGTSTIVVNGPDNYTVTIERVFTARGAAGHADGTTLTFRGTSSGPWPKTQYVPPVPEVREDFFGDSSYLLFKDKLLEFKGGFGQDDAGAPVTLSLDLMNNGYFGSAVALSPTGENCIVAAPNYTAAVSNTGGVFVFA